MKKLVLAMACVLSLGLLASCKQGTQDVNLKNQAATESYRYDGPASFSATKMVLEADSNSTVGAYKFTASTAKTSMVYSDKRTLATISWKLGSDKVEGVKTYDLYIPYVIDSDTDSNNLSDLSYGAFTINIYKIGDKYYTDSANVDPTIANNNGWNNATTRAEVKFSKGNPESETFTIESVGVLTNGWSVSNITFTRAK